MKKWLRYWTLLCACGVVALTADASQAAVKTWDGGGANGNWTTAANWDNDTAPVAGDSLVFAGTTQLAAVNDFPANTLFNGIAFSTGAGAFVLSGNTVNLGGNITANNTALTETVALPTLLTGASTFSVATSGTLVVSGAVNNNANTLTLGGGGGTLTISGAISGAGGLTGAGSATLTASGNANTYTGATSVNAGILSIGSTGAFPSSTASVTVASGATLNFSGSSNTLTVPATVPITLNGGGAGGNGGRGALNVQNDSKTVTINSPITLGSNSTIGGFGSGVNLTLAGNISGAFNLSFNPEGSGGSSVNFNINGANNYTGTTTFQTGGGNTSTYTLGNAAAIRSGSAILFNPQNGSYNLNLNINSYSPSISALGFAGNTANGARVFITNGSATLSTLTLTNTATADYYGNFTGNLALTKAGAATIIMRRANTYTGGTTINAGSIQLANAGGLGAASNTLTINGGTLDINGFSPTVGVLTGTSTTTAIINSASGTQTLTVGSGDAVATFGGLIVNNSNSGTGVVALTKVGVGTQTLTGANTYSGLTTISVGTLQIGNGGTAGTLGTGAVTDNATLTFNRSNALLVANDISGTGTLVKTGPGTTTLTGANTYSGTTTISAGTLQVGSAGTTGTLGTGAVTDNAILAFTRSNTLTIANAISGTGSLNQNGSGTLFLTGTNTYTGGTSATAGTIGGTGALGGATNIASTAIHAPGVNNAATQNVNGDYTLGGTLSVDVNGTTAGSFDQVNVTGAVILNGGPLVINSGFNLSSGGPIVIINNDGADAVNGTFANIPQGGTLSAGGSTYIVSYTGGDGNDVTLTLVSVLKISEFRFSGPGGITDEYIELANQTGSAVDLTGWTLSAGTTTTALTGLDLTGKTIPAYGHLLITNSGYTLGSGATAYPATYPTGSTTPSAYATGDVVYTGDIALASTLTLSNGSTVVDSVGDVSGTSGLISTNQYAFVRRQDGAAIVDTGTDQNDLVLVDTASTNGPPSDAGISTLANGARLGTPGPQNAAGPVRRATLTLVPLDPATNQGIVPEGRYASRGSSLDPFGRLTLRRTLTNYGSTTLKQIRFTLVRTPAGSSSDASVADLRAITSVGVSANGSKVVQGIQIEAPTTPTTPSNQLSSGDTGNGGGMNASWNVGTLPAGGLAPGQSMNVEFVFGIVRLGNYNTSIVIDVSG